MLVKAMTEVTSTVIGDEPVLTRRFLLNVGVSR